MPVPIDLNTAAIRRLQQSTQFALLLTEGVIGTDAEPGDSLPTKIEKAWLFQGLDDEGRPFRDVEGSGLGAVVITERTEWSGPNAHNTLEFPRLQVLVYMDSSRDAEGAVWFMDAPAKCKYAMSQIDQVFHIPGNSDHSWPGLYVISSLRGGVRDIRDIPGTQSKCVRGERVYNIEQG